VAADLCPVADGGEGTGDALLVARGGERIPQVVDDALGRPTETEVVLLGDGSVGVVEVAGASGLASLTPGRRDPWAASTRGTGELILDAFELGAREVIVAAGGSATTDGGLGAIEVLEEGREGRELRLTVLCDVETTWESCAATYGPQKGADAGQVVALAERLDVLAGGLPRDPRGLPMGGAAGGLSGGLWAAFGARLLPGAPFVLGSLDVGERLARSRFAITGEGRLDGQSAMGKLVGEMARVAADAGRRLHVVTGSDGRVSGSGPVGLASVMEARTLSEVEVAGREIALTELEASG
jgi:glycerate kinase